MPSSRASLVLLRSRLFRDKTGLVHASTGHYGANSLMLCEQDAIGGLDLNMRGMEEVWDQPISCLQCFVLTG